MNSRQMLLALVTGGAVPGLATLSLAQPDEATPLPPWGSALSCSTPDPESSPERGLHGSSLWIGGIVPYVFSSNVSAENRQRTLDAWTVISSVSTVRFVPWALQPNYLEVIEISDPSCGASFSSHLGRRRDPGQQSINICVNHWGAPGLIMHETMHALGLWHEHQRPGRDKYIEVLPAVVNQGGYRILNNPPFDAFPHGPYDLASLMHYDQVGPVGPIVDRVITVREPYRRAWQYNIDNYHQPNAVPSNGDIRVLNFLYPGASLPPDVFALVSPVKDAAVGESWTPAFEWEISDLATLYRLQVDDSPVFDSPVIDVETTEASYMHTDALEPRRIYWWRVISSNATGHTESYPFRSLSFYTAAEYPATLCVDDSAPDGGDGASWETALRDLATAIEIGYASGGATTEIRVAGGLYKPDFGTGDRTLSFWLPHGCAVRGGYAGYGAADPDARDVALHEAILSGDLNGDDEPGFTNIADNSRNLVQSMLNPVGTVLEGFTIRGGRADAFGNKPGLGAGAEVNGGAPAFRACRFTCSHADDAGGAIATYASDTTMTLERCRFDGNRMGPQGFTFIYAGGGAVMLFTSNDLMTDCIFCDNISLAGGGLFCWAARPRLTNCLFAGNTVSGASGPYSGGGAVFAANASQAVLTNCSIVENISTASGGGVRRDSGSPVTIANSIVWGNTPNQLFGAMSVSYSDVQGGAGGTGNIATDPMFRDPTAGNFRLAPFSPCLDNANNLALTAGIATDLDGLPRFRNDPWTPDLGVPGGTGGTLIVDMGAYEFQAASCRADINNDGVLNSQDFFTFVPLFFDAEADFNDDGVTNSQDFFDFLAAFFAGCP